ncbi:MAG: hypothetical protein V3V29_09645 [Acidimicrobiia bacterium]
MTEGERRAAQGFRRRPDRPSAVRPAAPAAQHVPPGMAAPEERARVAQRASGSRRSPDGDPDRGEGTRGPYPDPVDGGSGNHRGSDQGQRRDNGDSVRCLGEGVERGMGQYRCRAGGGGTAADQAPRPGRTCGESDPDGYEGQGAEAVGRLTEEAVADRLAVGARARVRGAGDVERRCHPGEDDDSQPNAD